MWFAHDAEVRYTPIEGEALAVAYVLQQTRYYTQRCTDLIVATDHKPLLGVLNDRSLTDITKRCLFKFKEKTVSYQFEIVHVPGRKNTGADAASWYPGPSQLASSSSSDDQDTADDVAIVASSVNSLYAVTNATTWKMVKEATAPDGTMRQLTSLFHEGFPDSRHLSPELRPIQRISGSLSIVDGVILAGRRLVIPSSLRPNILNALHATH